MQLPQRPVNKEQTLKYTIPASQHALIAPPPHLAEFRLHSKEKSRRKTYKLISPQVPSYSSVVYCLLSKGL